MSYYGCEGKWTNKCGSDKKEDKNRKELQQYNALFMSLMYRTHATYVWLLSYVATVAYHTRLVANIFVSVI
jgi:hypothetical protein